MATIDLTATIQAVAPFAATAACAAITYVAPLALNRVQKWLGFNLDAKLRDDIDMAIQRGAGLAYTTILSSGQGVYHIPTQNAALAAGANYVLSRVPDAIKGLGLTPQDIADSVKGELGKLLAQDPTISVSGPRPMVDLRGQPYPPSPNPGSPAPAPTPTTTEGAKS